jgi:predicted nucleotidyltransferase
MSKRSADQVDSDTITAARAFVERAVARYPVRNAFLFGSRARGVFRADSDADIAVMLRGQSGDFLDTKLALADIAYEILLETGIRIQPLPVWEREWQDPDSYSNPRLLRNIERDGIRL